MSDVETDDVMFILFVGIFIELQLFKKHWKTPVEVSGMLQSLQVLLTAFVQFQLCVCFRDCSFEACFAQQFSFLFWSVNA